MRAVWIRKHGGPGVLEVRETADPIAGPGEVRVRAKACGLNFAEISARQGIYPDAPKPPCVVGYEGAGVVDAVGEGVDDIAIGARVMFVSRFGGHSDTVVVKRYMLVPIPDALSFEDAAAMPVNYLTAYQMLFRLRRIEPGDRVLIHAAAGGVGTAVLQLCQTVEGVTTFGTASASKHDHIRAQGCTHPIDYHSTNYVDAVNEITNDEGVDLVCDALGGGDWKKGYSLLRPSGMLVCFGFANASKPGTRSLVRLVGQVLRVPKYGPLGLMGDNRSVAGLNLGSLWAHEAKIQDGLRKVVGFWEAGAARPHIDGTYPFADAARAHERLEQGKSVGKILLVPA